MSLIAEWPPDALMPILKLAMLFGLAQGQGLAVHFLCAGPTLVGEILAGFVVGPVLNLAPMMDELQIVGQLALMVIVFERGLYTNFASIAQCGAVGALMAILSITLSMTLVTIALRVNGIPFIEAVCGACIMSASVVGLVDIGWARRQVNNINPCSSLASKIIDAATTINSMLILATMTVMRNIDPTSEWYHPVEEWWRVCQPMLFSLAFIVASIFMRIIFNFFCLKDVIGAFFPPKNDPSNELYNALDFVHVTFMTAFALGMGVAASIVKVPAIVGIFVAGMSFGGSEACRLSWDRNTCNLTHWLSRIFFTCSIGFIMPEGMVTMEAVLDGWEIASAAFFGSFIAGALGGLILLYKEKNPLPNVVMCGSAMAYCGEMGFILLHEFWRGAYLSSKTLSSLMWGLLLSAVIAPALCQLCVFLQTGLGDDIPKDSEGSAAKYKVKDAKEAAEGGGESVNKTDTSVVQGMDTKASQFRSSMQYGTPLGDREREVPLIYNGQNMTSPHVPSPKEPSPTQAPTGPAGVGGRTPLFPGSATQGNASRALPPTISPNGKGDPSLPPGWVSQIDEGTGRTMYINHELKSFSWVPPSDTLSAQKNGYTPNSANVSQSRGLGMVGTPDNPITAVPINSQLRRTVPSIWAEDDD